MLRSEKIVVGDFVKNLVIMHRFVVICAVFIYFDVVNM